MKLRPMSLNRGKVCTRAASLHLRLLLFTLSLFHVSHPSYSTVYIQHISPCLGSRGVTADTHRHACPRIPKSQKRRYAQSLARVTFRVAHTSSEPARNTHQRSSGPANLARPTFRPIVSRAVLPATAGGPSLVSIQKSRVQTNLNLEAHPSIARYNSLTLHWHPLHRRDPVDGLSAHSCVVCFTAVIGDVKNRGIGGHWVNRLGYQCLAP
ncbi:hypothetical protein CTAM01_15034 [Colletotrichum tamarilloi]|uniref:Secreted protein n=1 Tax=Colletotrichum tamarilloi TaxID=1209934 RepID=A0ABQ9QMH9_9PEZI|nr:uncharacterized protein CTAM01_15034 [Colletotrichum tamarilloi]KAK1478309.1 hypothetical protein CTAM01_15034 [Colletotrichum tamarilloi]